MKKLFVTSVMAFALCNAVSAITFSKASPNGTVVLGSKSSITRGGHKFIICKGTEGICIRISTMTFDGEPAGSWLVSYGDSDRTFTVRDLRIKEYVDDNDEECTQVSFIE